MMCMSRHKHVGGGRLKMDLVRSLTGRPPIVKLDGWVIYLSVHDAEYLRTRREWRQKLRVAHPDQGGSAYRFRLSMGAYRSWLATENRYYARLSLTPPRWGSL